VETTESPEAELRKLRKENRELQARCEILKNGEHLQQPVVERYGAIRQMKTDHPITLLCATLEASRSGYHACTSDENQRRARADEALRPKLHAVFAATRQSYGYPRMPVELRAQGEQVGKTRVARLMREESLQGRQRGRFRPRTTESNHDGPIAPNRLAQAGPITACDQVWQTDITYLPPAQAGSTWPW
jgi:putative transposase